MAGAPPPMQMMPMQFAQGGGMGDVIAKLQGLAKAAPGAAQAIQGAMAPSPVAPGAAIPGAEGPTSAGGPAGPAPLVSAPGALPGTPGSTAYGPAAQPAQTGILDALKGLSPPQILDALRAMSQRGQSVTPPGMPGSTALMGAGMIPGG